MELGLTRRNIGRLVLLGWAVMLAWLARREFAQGDQAELTERVTRFAPSAQYYGVYADGRQIGQMNLTVDTLVDGMRISELLVLDVPSDSATHQLVRAADFSLSRSLRLRRFSRSVFGVGPQERLDGEVLADSTIRLVETEAPHGPAARARLHFDPDDILPALIPYRVAFGGRLRVGTSFTLPVMDLDGAGTTRDVAIRVTAESTFIVPDSAVWDSAAAAWAPATLDTIRAWRVEHDGYGAPGVSWIDAGGILLRQRIGSGVTLERSAFEIVRNNYRQRRRTESQRWRRTIAGMRTLTGSGRTPDTVAALRRIVASADSGGGGWQGTLGLAGGRQRVAGDTITISRGTPPDSAERPPSGETEPTWELPARDPEVLAAAARAASGALSSADTARRLTRWVAREITTDTGGTASAMALFTLRAGRGSADGKARLLASMARAIGIPARMVSGLAVFPDGSFGHAWVELWNGRWTAADPTFGHYPASASLLRLGLGGGSRAVDQVLVTGSARFLPIRTGR